MLKALEQRGAEISFLLLSVTKAVDCCEMQMLLMSHGGETLAFRTQTLSHG